MNWSKIADGEIREFSSPTMSNCYIIAIRDEIFKITKIYNKNVKILKNHNHHAEYIIQINLK